MNNCPACGAPLELRPGTEGFRCAYCHSTFFPQQPDDGVEVAKNESSSSLSCPVCQQPLVPAKLAGASVLYCTQCHGQLMPMPVLADIVDELRTKSDQETVQTSADRDELKRVLQCPQCNRRMDTHFYAGPGNVVVDGCDNCSLIWLDSGEATRIARAPDNEQFDRTFGF